MVGVAGGCGTKSGAGSLRVGSRRYSSAAADGHGTSAPAGNTEYDARRSGRIYTDAEHRNAPIYNWSADNLYAAVITMAEKQARTYLLARYDDRRQAHFVKRTTVFGFPDLITVQVLEDGGQQSRLLIWSRSIYGHSDFGVNCRRVARWLAAIRDTKL